MKFTLFAFIIDIYLTMLVERTIAVIYDLAIEKVLEFDNAYKIND